uniref:hypothetical protein n=1 Tax=Candidatus Fimivicinus sp. TaxID=3056640 RepID=UPI003FEFA748
FSCFVLFASSKENEVASAKPASQLASEPFRNNYTLCLPFLIAMTREEEIGSRSGRAGPTCWKGKIKNLTRRRRP